MNGEFIDSNHKNERGAALVMVLLSLGLLLALAMGMTLTAISELGVSSTYGNQNIALQSAEAGLNHAANLVQNFRGAPGVTPNKCGPTIPNDQCTLFTELLSIRSNLTTNYLNAGNPFLGGIGNDTRFETGTQLMEALSAQGHQLRDATGTPVEGAYYRISVIDDEPTTAAQLPKVPNFTPGVGYFENDNDPARDKNNRIVIYSTGTFRNASVTLEGWMSFLPFPAFSANGDIVVGGSSDIMGAYGGVHSNSDLFITNNAVTIAQTATASGIADISDGAEIGGFSGGGQERLEIPPLVTREPLTPGGPQTNPRLQEFLIRAADRILIDPEYADGAHNNDPNGVALGVNSSVSSRLRVMAERLNVSYSSLALVLDEDLTTQKVDQEEAVAIQIVRDANGNGTASLLTDAGGAPTTDPSATGWSHNDSSGWNLASLSAAGHNYFVIGRDRYSSNEPNGGNVKITANTGTPGNPVQITIMATGSIEIEGNPNMVANLRNLPTPLLPPFVKIDILLAAVEDIQIRGNMDGAQAFSGIVYAGEQVDLSGNGTFDGQVIAFSNPSIPGSLVHDVPNVNTITGSFLLTLNQGNSIGRIALFSWRQIKQ